MKLQLFLFWVVCSVSLFAQTENYSVAELKTQYFTKRNAALSSSSKSISEENQTALNSIVEALKTKDANSFEYNLVVWVNGNYNLTFKDNLIKAYGLNSNDETVQKEMLAYYILSDNVAKQSELLAKVSKFYTTNETKYYQDAMPESGIIFASNFEDFYGFLVAKSSYGIGSNVQVFCMDLMKNTDYLKDVSTACSITQTDFLGNEKLYFKKVLTSSPKTIRISLTVPQDYLTAVSDNVFVTGLFYEYGSVNQLNSLQNFWTKLKSKDIGQLTLQSSEKKL